MRRSLVILIALTGCSGRVEKDNRPAFTIDRTQPFWLELGRGSGLHGLETVKMDQTGKVVLHRQKLTDEGNVTVQTWELATLELPPETVAEVLKAVDANGLMG